MGKKLNHNLMLYVRLILRQERIRIAIWLVAILMLVLVVTQAYMELTPTEQERQVMAETMDNPAVTAMFGPGYGLDDYTVGIMMGHQMLLFTAIIVSIMSILLMMRHTRGDEENGRIEMLRALPVGRLSNLSANALVMLGANLLLALLVGVGLPLMGIESIDWRGSFLYGAALGATGLFFAALTALFAQLSESSRGTMGLAFAFLGLFYLLRAVGDVDMETLSLVSPLGWIVRTEVYLNNYWWPVGLMLAASLAVLALSLYLNSIRDLGAGFIPAKPGRKTASVFLQGTLGLACRLQRNAVIAWAVGLFVLGASYGSVMGELEIYLETLELIREMLPEMDGYTLTERFIPMLMTVISMVAAIPVLLMIAKLRGEELRHRTENLLARAVSRKNLLGSYILLSLLLSLVMQLLGVIGLWSAGEAVTEEAVSFTAIFDAGMVFLPATWVMVGVAVLLVGFLPRGIFLAWVYLGYSFMVNYLGDLLQLPDWMATLTPYGHVPQLPMEEINYTGLLVLTAIALALLVVGAAGYCRRDMEG